MVVLSISRGGRIALKALGNANGRVTCGREVSFIGNCDKVPIVNGLGGNAGCTGVSGTGCGIGGGCIGDGGP